jgi:hypothetical protein
MIFAKDYFEKFGHNKDFITEHIMSIESIRS